MTLATFPEKVFKTIKLALPIIIGQLGIMLMGLADTIQVGRMKFLAAESLGASGMAGSIFFTIAVVGLICMNIVSPMVSKAAAEGDLPECGNLLRASIRVALFLAVITIVILGIIGLNYDLFGQTAINKKLTLPFLALISASVIPIFIFSALKTLTDGLQKPRIAMTITLIALFLNILWNSILINGYGPIPALGLMGAGIATLMARIFMAASLAIYIFTRREFKPYLAKSHVHHTPWVLEKTILKVGVPSGFQGFFEIATFGMAVVMMGWISITSQAAHIVAINMASLTYMAATGIAAAGGILVGEDIGNKSKPGIYVSGNAALFLSLVFMGICALVMFFGREFFVTSYTKEIAVVSIAVQLVIWGAIFQLFDGVQAVSLGLLRGLQDVKIPTLITIFSYWGVGIPLSYYLGILTGQGAEGIWIGLTASLICSSILLTWRFYVRTHGIDLDALKVED